MPLNKETDTECFLWWIGSTEKAKKKKKNLGTISSGLNLFENVYTGCGSKIWNNL